MINWATEWPLIITQAWMRGADARFVRAIRQQENGPPGREFGVLSIATPFGYKDQLKVCCITVAHLSAKFDSVNPALMDYDDRFGAFYTTTFITYFGRIWAPPKAPNDPNGLNANWIANVTQIYMELVKGETANVG